MQLDSCNSSKGNLVHLVIVDTKESHLNVDQCTGCTVWYSTESGWVPTTRVFSRRQQLKKKITSRSKKPNTRIVASVMLQKWILFYQKCSERCLSPRWRSWKQCRWAASPLLSTSSPQWLHCSWWCTSGESWSRPGPVPRRHGEHIIWGFVANPTKQESTRECHRVCNWDKSHLANGFLWQRTW